MAEGGQLSNDEAKKVSVHDIQVVQNLIERCIQLYMSRKEAVSTLLQQAKVEPGFTELVWEKLELENQGFFKVYHLRLILKDQILRFNQLLSRQVELMPQLAQTDLVSIPHSDPSEIHSMLDNLPYQSPQLSIEPQNMQQATNYVPGADNNMLLAQSTNVGMMQGMIGYASDSPLFFGADSNRIGDASSSFTGEASNSQLLNEIFDTETNSFGVFGQMQRNISFSNLTDDSTNRTDILNSYSGPPFMGTYANIMDPHIPGKQQGFRSNRRG